MNRTVFAKYEGLGNSFVLLDYSQNPTATLLPVQQRQWLCNPQYGIGADGVLTLFAPRNHPQAAIYMHITNADGSTAATCGNGLRCVAVWLQQQHKVDPNRPCSIATDAGVRQVHFTPQGIRINMGVAHITPPPPAIAAQYPTATLVNIGNNHLVLPHPPHPHQAAQIATSISQNSHLPPLNVALYQSQAPHHMQLCVHEHGAGPTAACGSGACAAVTAAIASGTLQQNQQIKVNQPGGQLTIVQDTQNHMWMTGPAHKICEGTAWLPSHPDSKEPKIPNAAS